jgi:myosin heavy subunit
MPHYKPFVIALKQKYDLEAEELKPNGWKYCGGNENGPKGAYRDDFRKHFGHYNFPSPVEMCVCDVEIHYNCYICNQDEEYCRTLKNKEKFPHIDGYPALILGSCCITEYTGLKMQLECYKCGEPHRRNKNTENLCAECGRKQKAEKEKEEREKIKEMKKELKMLQEKEQEWVKDKKMYERRLQQKETELANVPTIYKKNEELLTRCVNLENEVRVLKNTSNQKTCLDSPRPSPQTQKTCLDCPKPSPQYKRCYDCNAKHAAKYKS